MEDPYLIPKFKEKGSMLGQKLWCSLLAFLWILFRELRKFNFVPSFLRVFF